MPSFGHASQAVLATLHHDMQIILTDLIEVYDVSLLQGARTIEEQIRNIRKRVSKTLDSRHIPRDAEGNYDPNSPAIACDMVPYAKGVNPWPLDSDAKDVREKKAHRFYYMHGRLSEIAHRHGIFIRQGIDWDMDGDYFDQSFDDLPHWELHVEVPKLVVPTDLLTLANEALAGAGLPKYRNP